MLFAVVWEYCVAKNCGRTIKGNGGDTFGYVFGEKCSLQQVKRCDAFQKGVIVFFFILFHLSWYVQSNIVIYSLFLCDLGYIVGICKRLFFFLLHFKPYKYPICVICNILSKL